MKYGPRLFLAALIPVAVLSTASFAKAPEKSLTGKIQIEKEAVKFFLELEATDSTVKAAIDTINQDLSKEWEGTAELCNESTCFQVVRTEETQEANQQDNTLKTSVTLVVLQSVRHKAPFTDDYWPGAIARFQFEGEASMDTSKRVQGKLTFIDVKKYNKEIQ
jgi:hypothetical protein